MLRCYSVARLIRPSRRVTLLLCLANFPEVRVSSPSFIRSHLSLLMQSSHGAETGHILLKYHLSSYAGEKQQSSTFNT